jgi:hypothetical protein
MIKIWHIKNEFGTSGDRDEQWNLRADVMCSYANEHLIPAVKAVLNVGGAFVAVATFESPLDDLDALERAWIVTQNGVISDSWSQRPPEGLTPLGETFFVRHDKRSNADVRFGRKSSDKGDIFQIDNKFYVCASIGFTEIDSVRVSEDGTGLEIVA